MKDTYEFAVNTTEKETTKKINFRNLIGDTKNIILYVISILVSRVGLVAGVTPFGLAMLGAMSGMNVPLILPLAIIAITTVVTFGWVALLKFIISALIFTLLKSFIKFGDNKTGNTVKILFASAIGEIFALMIKGSLVYDALLAVYAALTSGIFYLIFSEGLPVIKDCDSRKIFSSETLLATGILMTIAISGLGSMEVFNISIRGILCVLLVLLLGWKRGASVGAAAGIAISLTLGLIGIGNVATIATYGFSGLLAGIFSKYGKVGAAIGFVLGNIILAFYANGSTEVIVSIKEIVVASVCLFLVPKKATIILDNLFDYSKTLPEGEVDGYFPESTLYRLNAVSEVVSDIANTVEENDKSKEENIDEVGMFIKTLSDNTCKRCPNYDTCWKQNYHSMYETVFNAIETLQLNGEINEFDIDKTVCENNALLVDGLNFSYQIYKVNQNWQQKMKEKRKQVSKQLKGVSNAINKIKEDITSNMAENIMPEGKFSLEIGMARTKKTKSEISGDNAIMVRLKDGKYMFGVSDGMGSGEKANQSSKRVISMLEKLLNTGFEKKDALELVNSVMSFNEEEDSFATLDVSMFDTLTGDAEFLKVSACPTFIKKDENVDIVNSVSLPVGILENADVELYDKTLDEGDVIVMITDGILDANKAEQPKEKWVLELLKAINPENPQRLADIILQEAMDSNFGIAEDDMTVIVAKVKKQGVQ